MAELVDEVTNWVGDQDWIHDLPFKKIANAVLSGAGGGGSAPKPSEDDNDDDDKINEEEDDQEEDVYYEDEGNEDSEKQDDINESTSFDEKSHDQASPATATSRGLTNTATTMLPTLAKEASRPAPNNAANANTKGKPNPVRKPTQGTGAKPGSKGLVAKGVPAPQGGPNGKRKVETVVSRRTDAFVLLFLAVLYITLAVVCFVAYGISGKYWYNSSPQSLTTVLAILGVSFSLLNKFSTTSLTTAYRREIGADLLGRQGLTLQNLVQYDQFINRSTLSLLGNKGFRTITMPVGICIIVASAILKKSFTLALLPAPVNTAPMDMTEFGIKAASYLISDKHPFLTNDVSQDHAISVTLTNLTTALEIGYVYSSSLFITQYNIEKLFEDGSNELLINGDYPPLNGTIFGTPTLPLPVYNQEGNYTSILARANPLVMAKQTDIISTGLYSYGDTGHYLAGASDVITLVQGETSATSVTSQMYAYVYNDTFAVAYNEFTGGDEEEPTYNKEYAFQMFTGKADTQYLSDGDAVYYTVGGTISTQSDTPLSINMTVDEPTRAAASASELITSLKVANDINTLYNASSEIQELFEERLIDIAATLALTFGTDYDSSTIQQSKIPSVEADVVKFTETLIFGHDYYTLILGILLCLIGFSVAAWAYKSIKKPLGVEFKMITAMSMVANSIDPNTSLSRAINQMEVESDKKPKLPSKPSLPRKKANTPTKTTAAADSSDPEKMAASSVSPPRKVGSTGQSTAIRRPTRPQVRRQRSLINPATMRLGLDISSRLIRLMDDGDDDGDDDAFVDEED